MYGAEFMDFIIRSGRLSAELVARNIQNLKSLIVIILIKLLNRSILRSKAAACGRVHHKNHFSFIISQIEFLSAACCKLIIVNHLIHPFSTSSCGCELRICHE